MNYTLHQLKIFQKVVQTQSITRTAADLHLTQPAVSIQLKNFQEQFDLPLLEVVNKRIYITDFGLEIAESAEKILAEVHAINYKMHAHKGELTGKLKISVVSTGKYIAPYFLADFMNNNKGVELLMDVTNKSQVVQSLSKNEVDFALVSVLPDYLKVEHETLLQNKLWVVGNDATDYHANSYDVDIFREMPLIYREQGSGTRHVMEKFILQNDIPVLKKMELTSNEAVKQAVIAGLGYSIMPLIGIKNELLNGQLKIIPVAGFPIISNWSLIWLNDKRFSPVAAAYLQYIRLQKENIIRQNFKWYEQF